MNAIHQIFDAWRNGKRSVLLQMPTGTGKTVLFTEITRLGHEHGRHIVICVHRRELIDPEIDDSNHPSRKAPAVIRIRFCGISKNIALGYAFLQFRKGQSSQSGNARA